MLSPHDLDYVFQNTAALWEDLRDKQLFITGGTGFFGCWLLESLLWANKKLNLNVSATLLTRSINQFRQKSPHFFLEPALTFLEGDIRSFKFPNAYFSHVIHAATEASASLNKEQPDLMFDTILAGTERALAFAVQCGSTHFLLTSSGAVYGKQPSHLSLVSEDYDTQEQETLKSAYADGKRQAETLCDSYFEKHNLNIKIARCFAFVGPYLPLDTHFAIGNFIHDALRGTPILIKGDGSPYRSYLYAADLTVWLWTILLRAKPMRPYNVGSDEAVSIKELAHLVADIFKPQDIDIRIEQPSSSTPPERYVPDISRARLELNLTPKVGLRQGIQLTKEWYSSYKP